MKRHHGIATFFLITQSALGGMIQIDIGTPVENFGSRSFNVTSQFQAEGITGADGTTVSFTIKFAAGEYLSIKTPGAGTGLVPRLRITWENMVSYASPISTKISVLNSDNIPILGPAGNSVRNSLYTEYSTGFALSEWPSNPMEFYGVSFEIDLPSATGVNLSNAVFTLSSYGGGSTFPTYTVLAPKPPKLTASVVDTTAHITFANLIPNREYRLMRSGALNAWEEAHRFTPTVPTGSWSEALDPEGRQFYRLEWNE